MPELDINAREQLRSDQFAYVDSRGEKHLPIHGEEHVRNAIARYGMTDFESKAAQERARRRILRAAEEHGIETAEDSDVQQPVS